VNGLGFRVWGLYQIQSLGQGAHPSGATAATKVQRPPPPRAYRVYGKR